MIKFYYLLLTFIFNFYTIYATRSTCDYNGKILKNDDMYTSGIDDCKICKCSNELNDPCYIINNCTHNDCWKKTKHASFCCTKLGCYGIYDL